MDSMTNAPLKRLAFSWGVWVIGVGVVTAVILWTLSGLGRGFEISDEGYYWYGVQRTLAGECPLRDFQSYDPGRYLFGAGAARFLGAGLVEVRVALAGLFIAVLWMGLCFLSRRSPSPLRIVGYLVVATLWTFPHYKVFEVLVSVFTVLLVLRWIEKPDPERCFQTGLGWSLLLFWGENLTFYGAVALVLAGAWLRLKVRPVWTLKHTLSLGGGIAVGSGLFGVYLAAHPGLFTAYLDFIRESRHGGNGFSPLPAWIWPWHPSFPPRTLGDVSGYFYASLFLLVPLGYAVGTLGAFRRWTIEEARPLVAAIAVGFPYLHYYITQPNMTHLMLGTAPAVLALFAFPIPRTGTRRFFIPILLALSVLVAAHTDFWKSVRLGPGLLKAERKEGRILPLGYPWDEFWGRVEPFVARAKDSGGAVWAGPYFSGLYAAFNLRCPTWENFLNQNFSVAMQERTIRELQTGDVRWVVVCLRPPGGTIALGMPATHPLLWDYLRTHFRPVEQLAFPAETFFLVRKDVGRMGEAAR